MVVYATVKSSDLEKETESSSENTTETTTEQEITTAKTEKPSTVASGEVSDNSTKTGDSSQIMLKNTKKLKNVLHYPIGCDIFS